MTTNRSYWSRRRFIGTAGLAAVGLATVATVGCGDDDDHGGGSPTGGATASGTPQPSGGTSTVQAKTGGRYLNVFEGYQGNADPHLGSVAYQVTSYMGDPLIVKNNATGELKPGVAASWEQPDKTVVVLKVQPGVKFFDLPPANGRTLEAKDIVYMLKSWNGSQYPGAKVAFPRKSILDGMTSATAVDSSTVRIEFSAPRSDILAALAEPRAAVLPEGLREAFGDITSLTVPDKAKLIGTGPFIADSLDPSGQALWKRNPNYWRKGFPYLDEIQTNVVADTSTWATFFASGQNYSLEAVSSSTYDLIKKGVPNLKMLYSNGGPAFTHMGLNTRVKPLNDPRVRTALALIFDKPAFANAVFGEVAGNKLAMSAGPLFNVFPEAIPQDELAKTPGVRSPTAEDIKTAKDMAAQAGISASTPVTLKLTTPDLAATLQFKLAAEHLKDQAAKYIPGLNIEIELTDYTSMLAKVANPDSGFHIYFGNWVHEPTAIGTLALVYRSTGGRNFTGFADPAVDSLILSAYGELDATKRTSTMREIQQKALQNWSHIPISQGRAATALQPFVEGYDQTSTVGQIAIRNAWLSKS